MSSLPSQKRFYNPEGRQLGCCICRLRISSSLFTHSSKFTKEEMCDAYGLHPLSLQANKQRFGYMCNPCRLATRRYLQARKASSSTTVPNLADTSATSITTAPSKKMHFRDVEQVPLRLYKRLDSKLQGSSKQTTTTAADAEVKVKEARRDNSDRPPPVVPQETVPAAARWPHVVYTGVKRPTSKKGSVTKDENPALSQPERDSLCGDRTVAQPGEADKTQSVGDSLCLDRTVAELRETDKRTVQEPTTHVDRGTAGTESKRNRRVQRQPVRNLKPRQESFIDLTYFQQIQLPCGTFFLGEGGMVVMQADTFKQTTAHPSGDLKEESK